MQDTGPTAWRGLRRSLALISTAAALVAAACSAAATTVPPTVLPTQAPTAPPTAEPTPAPSCPEPTEGTRLLRHDEHGYCLLYPEGLVRIDIPPYEVCLVPDGPAMLCHSAAAFIEVTDAGGRSASQLADDKLAQEGFTTERSSTPVAGEQAVVLAVVPGQAGTRWVMFVHQDRLYALKFVLPGPEDAPAVEQLEQLYETVINSFTFIPRSEASVASSAAADPEASEGGSAVVVFVEGGNVLIWEAATGERRTIVDSGDVIRVELSDDAAQVALVRRTYFAAGEFDRNEQSSLWVIGLDGSNPRELVSAERLRQQVGAAGSDSSNFPRLDWIPNTHRLLYSGNTYEAHGYGEGAHTALMGVYLIDADTVASAELAPAGTSYHFVPSPDGRQVALVDTTGLIIVDAESGRRVREFPARPVVGDTGWFAGAGVWTQDSSAFLVNALVEPANVTSDYELWRVPVDGSTAEALLSFSSGGGSVVYSPDGSSAAMLKSASGIGPSVWSIVPLPDDLGPLAVPRDTFDYSGLSWSPGGTAFTFDYNTRGDWHPLCPNAEQHVEVCGAPIHFPLQIEWFEWIDRSRFLYVTILPRQLYVGSLDGSATLIAEDPLSFDAAAATCTNNSEFVTDVTVPDGTHFAPGTAFHKAWRIRNTGTCAWDAAYRLGFLSGERMSGPRSTPLGDLGLRPEGRGLFPAVRPGEQVDLSVLLIAPEAAGTHRGQWTLFAPDGTPFGTRPFVQIQVP